ncbi:hypothetical protein J8281_05300 [Aquimarina sp. U1-2]|uniref:hypothetical protein n=1 Tax=Aquimarina sp. U1-2 TaxID=2823141 RepID=UPI001AEC864A|nr:hypothetical protein [Aquimarina sp. U1-2]MBP2831599.1 hypothetical protein [Aquimarina sp. U1-2]
MSIHVACPACKKEVASNEDICPTCDFPFNGSEKEKSIHIGRFINKKGIIIDSNNALKGIRNILFIVATFQILKLLISINQGFNDIFTIGIYVFLSLTFILSGILVKKSPLLFTIFPLILLLGLYFLQYLVDPTSIYSGIFFKIAIIGGMLYSVFLTIKSNKFKKTYNL